MNCMKLCHRASNTSHSHARRCLSTTTKVLARRRPTALEDSGPRFGGKGADIQQLTGDFDKDGCNRYELDFLETVEWTKSILTAMKDSADGLKDSLTPPPQPRVSLRINMAALTDLTEQQIHKLKLLAGNKKWDPHTNTIRFSCDRFPTTKMNMKWLADRADELLSEVRYKDGDTFEDIPLLVRKSHQRRTNLEFPMEWINASKRKTAGEAV